MKYPVNACSGSDALTPDDIHQIRMHRRLVWLPAVDTGEIVAVSEDPASAGLLEPGADLPDGVDMEVRVWRPLCYVVNPAAARILLEQLASIEQSLPRSILSLMRSGMLRARLPRGGAPGRGTPNLKGLFPDMQLGTLAAAAAAVVVLITLAASVSRRPSFVGKKENIHHV
jgi:hypothetical protein